jgi:hypothetical protein
MLSARGWAAIKVDDAVRDPAVLAQLQDQASHASPREQIFLYTEVVHVLSELAGHDLAAGELEKAAAKLTQVQHYAGLIHQGLKRDARRLQDAEMMLNLTTHHLRKCMHLVTREDDVPLEATLTQLNQVNDELLTQVFQH